MISPFNGHDFSKYITEVFDIPKNLKANEVLSVVRMGNVFFFSWRRGGKLYACKNVDSSLAFTLIMALKEEIKKRNDPDDRVEGWECINEHGVFDFSIYCTLLKSRSS